jgi:DNA-binding FrmR family transcriptional regulator
MDNHQGKLIRRLKIVEGQIRGLQAMVEKGVYCIDVITQTSAVRQALSGIEDQLMERHLTTCAMKRDEILKVYRLKRK